jgi:hypothetical protein
MRGIQLFQIRKSNNKFDPKYLMNDNDELFVVEYNGYHITIIRHKFWDNTYQSNLRIIKDGSQLVDGEPNEYGVSCALWIQQISSKNPGKTEEKLILKAKAIIDRLDENGRGELCLCNRGNIIEDPNIIAEFAKYAQTVS